MKAYFDDEERAAALYGELESWLDTPFRHKSGVKRKGCDCIHLVLRVIEAVGIPVKRKIIMPDYARDWHLHVSGETLADGIEKHLPVQRLGIRSTLKDGDILLYRYGRASSHSALYCRGMVYQALNGMSVAKIDVRGEQRERLTHIYRLVES